MPQFVVEPKLFADGPDGPYPVGSRCPRCSKVYFPRKKICTRCLGDNGMEDWPLSRKGTLMSFSVAHDSLMGLKTPYAFGYIRLPEGLVIYSLLTDCEPFEERL